jgi:hypothetical protein
MLKLRSVFQDSIDVLSEHAALLGIPALPATVFLMQRDVVNHYRYAATHYLPLTLDEHFLQNSSIGTPYEKWAKFTNEDFDELSYLITTLMRYTARLIHETETVAYVESRRYREASQRSNVYISPLVEADHKRRQIGLRVNPNETLTITPFLSPDDEKGSFEVRWSRTQPTEYFHIIRDSDGNEQRCAISATEHAALQQELRERIVPLQDRSILGRLSVEALAETIQLEKLNATFGGICNTYYSNREAGVAFDRLNESWWL